MARVNGMANRSLSLGKAWWKPCILNCQRLLSVYVPEWYTNRCIKYSESVKKKKPATKHIALVNIFNSSLKKP